MGDLGDCHVGNSCILHYHRDDSWVVRREGTGRVLHKMSTPVESRGCEATQVVSPYERHYCVELSYLQDCGFCKGSVS